MFPSRHFGARLVPAALSLLFFWGSAGCAHDPTIGPLFTESAKPDANTSRVYLYRVDPHHSFSLVEIELDHERTVYLLDEEYVSLEVEPGEHELEFRLKRRFGLPGSRWRTQRIRAKGGATHYFEIAVGVADRATTSVRESEIGGRTSSGTAGEVVSMRSTDVRKASERIRMTHLHVP